MKYIDIGDIDNGRYMNIDIDIDCRYHKLLQLL